MAKKRSKRASKASFARSKRRGKARAAPTEGKAKPKGVINAEVVVTENTQDPAAREQERTPNSQTKIAGSSDDNSLQRSVPLLSGQTEIDENLKMVAWAMIFGRRVR